MAEGEAVSGEQGLGLGGAQAGLEDGGAGDGVEVEQAVHAAQVQGDERAALGGESAHHRGAAAEGHDGEAVGGAGAQDGEDLVVVGGQDDGLGDVGDVAGADAQQVGGGLAAGVPDAALRVRADVFLAADGRGERPQGGGGGRGGGRAEVLQGEGRRAARLDAEQVAQQPGHRVGQRCRLGRVAPAVPQHVH